MEVIILIATLIFVAIFIFGLFCIADKVKDKEPRNRVRFYVWAIGDNIPWLYIQRKNRSLKLLACNADLKDFGLNPDDFADMKEGEIREVFINLED